MRAIARGVSVWAYRTAFIVLLSLVVGISIKAIGVLLMSAFVVIPACAARLLSRTFANYVCRYIPLLSLWEKQNRSRLMKVIRTGQFSDRKLIETHVLSP
nr:MULTISPECIES: metal ABC transporter permease [unclassified Coleofasciculus]